MLRGAGKPRDAASELAKLAREYPRDREVLRQFAQTLFALGQLAEARQAFEGVLAIDPTDAGSYQFLTAIYESAGQKTEADRANSLYLLWRDDPRADRIAISFFMSHPEWADERISSHVHSSVSPLRPTLVGPFATPDK